MECVTRFPLTNLDHQPRKRARLGWDVLPKPPKINALKEGLIHRSCSKLEIESRVKRLRPGNLWTANGFCEP
ncbi:Dual specificity protein kinase clk3, partial [Datura stramonium]|nr:Dual specificity protein kinase clk3 [Datura stramonium]